VPKDSRIPQLALPRIEGWTDLDHTYIPIGGILAPVRAVKKVAINTRVREGKGTYYVTGELVPPLENVPLAIEVIHESGAVTLFHTNTDILGTYVRTLGSVGAMKTGRYSVQVFTAPGGDAAETEGPIVPLNVA
jgi:hypothetical protein